MIHVVLASLAYCAATLAILAALGLLTGAVL